MTPELAYKTRKVALDEETFQQLLAAAHVLQQHTDRLIGNKPGMNSDRTEILTQLAGVKDLDVQAVAQTIAECLKRVTSATGIAIGVVEKDELKYLSAVGNASPLAGSRTPVVSSLSAESITTGTLKFGALANQDQFPSETAIGGSFISVPFRQGCALAGAVELRFDEMEAGSENDLAAAELMAGLMSDAVARSCDPHHRYAEVPKWTSGQKHSQIEQFSVVSSEGQDVLAESDTYPFQDPMSAEVTDSSCESLFSKAVTDPGCGACGHRFTEDQYFCGNCGLPRFVSETVRDRSQGNSALLWYQRRNNRPTATRADQATAGMKHTYNAASEDTQDLLTQEPNSSEFRPAASLPTVTCDKNRNRPLLTEETGVNVSRISVQEGILSDLVELAQVQTGASGAAIAIEHNGFMVCRAAAGEIAANLGDRINTASGLSGACVLTGRTQWCVDTEEDPRVDGEASRQLGVRSIVIMPLFDGERVIGIFETFSQRPDAFGNKDLQVLHELAGRATEQLESDVDKSAKEGAGTELKPAVHAPATIGQVHCEGVYSTAENVKNRDHRGAFLGAVVVGLTAILALGIGFYWGSQQTAGLHHVATTPNNWVGDFFESEVRERAPTKRGMIRGWLIHRVSPTYPSQALRQRVQGSVSLNAQISKDGLVRDITPVRGPPILGQAASEAVGQWRFEPYKLDGKPIDEPVQIIFRFVLPK